MTNRAQECLYQDLEVLDWGFLNYQEALLRQKALVEQRFAGLAPDCLVLVEHPPVVTIGRSGTLKDLCLSREELHQKGIAIHQVDRGGMATFHGPGQLVAYPIVKLNSGDLHHYVRTLLDVVSSTLRTYGLNPELQNRKPGVWVNGAKVASVGIAVRKWVTYHGVALNVNTDPHWFNCIVPCGNPNEKITSMEGELGFPLDLSEVKERFTEAFGRLFGFGKPSHALHKAATLPEWLIRPAPSGRLIHHMEERLRHWHLATVCQNAQCPNLGECFGRGISTFMILGTRCTRRCSFCAVDKGLPEKVDPGEPERVARAARALGLRYVVVTSVTRDDLPDGGAEQFTRTIDHIRMRCSDARAEVLVPDFKGSLAALQKVCEAHPDMFNHNIETVLRLYPRVRLKAEYRRSLGVLEYAARHGLRVKSGFMLGLGETHSEVNGLLADLKRTGCRYLTIGQYLAPSKNHFPVARFVPPKEFDSWAETARAMGFKGVAAGPLVRSSYRADELSQN